MKVPSRIKKTTKQLGLDRKDYGVLRLPDGLETVGYDWFCGRNIKKIIVPSSVKVLEYAAFCSCKKLREVVFEPGSCLERIEDCCFFACRLKKIIIPKSVKYIGDDAFEWCNDLS